MFRLTPDISAAGTSGLDAVVVPPAALVARFGPPPGRPSLDGKVSGEYRFTGPAGEVFTVHDYKETTLYYGDDTDRRWPTPAEFWAGTGPRSLTIGGHRHGAPHGQNPAAAAFRDWLLAECCGTADEPLLVPRRPDE